MTKFSYIEINSDVRKIRNDSNKKLVKVNVLFTDVKMCASMKKIPYNQQLN